MPLSEQQIHRYSRQILLAEVGGRGQSRLLESGTQVIGDGAAAQDAAVYLAASGVRVVLSGTVQPGEEGFLASVADLGRPRAEDLERTLRDFNPDAIGPQGNGCIAALPAPFSGDGPWVVIGGRGRRGAILYRSEKGCEGCFRKNLTGLEACPEGVSQVLLGALVALVFQRLRLNISVDVGGIWVAETGRLSAMSLERCSCCI